MEQLHLTFKTTSTAGQVMKLFMIKEEARRTWAEHFLYMVTVRDARGGADSLMLDNIENHASPELMNVMRANNYPGFLRRLIYEIGCSRRHAMLS